MRTRQGILASLSGLALIISCSVGKLFDSPPAQVIGVTPMRVVDSAPVGSTTSRAAALAISTTGGDQRRKWRAHRATNADWLFVSADTGSAPDTVELALDPTNLPPGIYRDTIVIVPDGQGAAQPHVPVELRILDTTTTPTPPLPATQLAFSVPPPSSIVLNTSPTLHLRPYRPLRGSFRRPLHRPPLLAQLRHRGTHVVRDLSLLPERRDHRLRLLGLERERARLCDGLIE